MAMTATCDIAIVDPASGEVLDRCVGPLPDGRCPRAADDGRVPCAGHALAPQAGTGFEGWKLDIVDADLDECPIAVLTGTCPVQGTSVRS